MMRVHVRCSVMCFEIIDVDLKQISIKPSEVYKIAQNDLQNHEFFWTVMQCWYQSLGGMFIPTGITPLQ
jgi:hypothetical protein